VNSKQQKPLVDNLRPVAQDGKQRLGFGCLLFAVCCLLLKHKTGADFSKQIRA
jgi:hypothetical protein